MTPLNETPLSALPSSTSPSIPTSRSEWKGRIVLLWSGLGEYAWAKRLENACRNLGWECRSSIDPAELSEYDKLVQDHPSTPEEISSLVTEFDPDCIISLKWDRIYAKKIPSYLALTGVFKLATDITSPSYDRYRVDLLNYDGFLTCVENDSIKRHCELNNKPYRAMTWYPSSTWTEYSPVLPKDIFCCGFQWDSRRNGPEYRKMFSLLDLKGVLSIYGPAHKWDCAPNSVKGMTFDENEFREAMRESGIVLALHTERNLEQGSPSARVFEAAAACCVIICDQHPFIIREFGDSVLYIDQDRSGEELYNQIQEHLDWILTNPEEAEVLARKAHMIFSSKFTLEKQLEELKHFHQEIGLQKSFDELSSNFLSS